MNCYPIPIHYLQELGQKISKHLPVATVIPQEMKQMMSNLNMTRVVELL